MKKKNTSSGRENNSCGRYIIRYTIRPDEMLIRLDELLYCPDDIVIRPNEILICPDEFLYCLDNIIIRPGDINVVTKFEGLLPEHFSVTLRQPQIVWFAMAAKMFTTGVAWLIFKGFFISLGLQYLLKLSEIKQYR